MQYRMVWAALILILALLPPVAAVEGDPSDLSQLLLTPANVSTDQVAPMNGTPEYSTLKKPAGHPLSGTTRFFRDTLPAGTPRYWMDITWNDPSRNLQVTVFSPEGSLGPYSNTANGRIDGRIFLALGKDPALPSGDWYYEIRTVPGTNYSFGIYRNNGS